MDNNSRRRTSSFLQYIDTRWIVWGGVIASALILILLLLSLLTGYSTGKRQLARQFTSVAVADGVALAVTYPRYLLLGKEPAALVVGLRVGATAVFTPPLTVTLDTPPSIAISGTVRGRHVFEEGNGAPAEFWLANTAILALRQRQTISLTHSRSPTLTLLTVAVEAPGTAVWREFIVGTVSDKSPLLLALAAILPIAALILQYVQKQEELESARREKQSAEDKMLLAEQVETLRRYLIETNRAGIQRVWTQINQSRSIKSLPPQDYNWLEQLVQFSLEGQQPDTQTFDEIAREWPAEAAGAFLCAGTNNKTLYDQIPLAKVTNPSLRNRLIETQRDRLPLQDWPPDISPPPDAVARSPLEKTPLLSILKKDPLLHSRAEDELSSLFGLGAFWMEHPLYARIAIATQSQVVVGARGSGRTALARALCYYEPQEKHHYWVYLSVLATQPAVVSDLRPALAEHLLQYTLSKPTLLSNLPDAALKLLGRLLAQALSPSFVLAKIERAIHRGGWYKPAEDHQKENWRAVGETQLQLLARGIEAYAQLSAAQWPRAYVECLTALGFRGLRLALDVAGRHAETYALLNELLLWQQAGAQMTIFLPQESLAVWQQQDADRQVLELAWSAEQLQKLLEHRFRKLAQRDLAQVFHHEETEAAFVQAAKTPRGMYILWTTILQTVQEWPDPPQILLEHMEQAAAALGIETGKGEPLPTTPRTGPETKARAKDGAQIQSGQLSFSNAQDKHELISKIRGSFTLEEIKDLCVKLDVEYEDLGGENIRSAKARELVEYMERHGRLSELIELLKEEGPSIAW